KLCGDFIFNKFREEMWPRVYSYMLGPEKERWAALVRSGSAQDWGFRSEYKVLKSLLSCLVVICECTMVKVDAEYKANVPLEISEVCQRYIDPKVTPHIPE